MRTIDFVPDRLRLLFVGRQKMVLGVRRFSVVLVLAGHVSWHLVIDRYHLVWIGVRHASLLRFLRENDSCME